MEKWTDEADLRAWLRKAWSSARPPLIWIEAAQGGTFGAPDVIIPLGRDRYVPVELKLAQVQRSIVTFYVRTAQRKLHRGLVGAGCRTAFLIGLEDGGVFIVRSGLAIDGPVGKKSMSLLVMWQVRNIEHLLATLKSEKFW